MKETENMKQQTKIQRSEEIKQNDEILFRIKKGRVKEKLIKGREQ